MVGMLSKTTITFPIIGDVKTNVAESYNNLFDAHSGLSALKGTILWLPGYDSLFMFAQIGMAGFSFMIIGLISTVLIGGNHMIQKNK